jgi:molybdenum cofactor cytidylyltransferase
VLGANCETIASTADLQNVQVVVNPNWEQGIATSIHAGLNALAKDVSSAMLLVCDQPLLTAQHLRALQTTQSNSSEGAIISSAYAGIHGIPAIFPASQFSRLLALSGDQGARLILRNSDATVISIPFEGGEIDIDTPSDLTDSRWAPSDPQRDEH